MNWNYPVNVLASTTETTGETAQAVSPIMSFLANYSGFIIIIFFFVVMYFLIIRPQKKRDKETAEMRNSLEVGDNVVTIGGIVGRVVNVKDDTVIIETGSDRNRLTFLKSAIQSKTKAEEE